MKTFDIIGVNGDERVRIAKIDYNEAYGDAIKIDMGAIKGFDKIETFGDEPKRAHKTEKKKHKESDGMF